LFFGLSYNNNLSKKEETNQLIGVCHKVEKAELQMWDDVLVADQTSLTERVAQKISRMIAHQSLQVGNKLPNEFQLAEFLNVGRGTIREAVKLLVSRNILVIERGKGTYVAHNPGVVADPWGFEYIQNKYKLALDLLEIRLIVEPDLAAMASLRGEDEDFAEISRICDRVESLIERNLPYEEEDMELHVGIARSTQNSVAPRLIPIISQSIDIQIQLMHYSRGAGAIEEHQKIVNSIVNRQPDEARRHMQNHLRYNQEKMALLFSESRQQREKDSGDEDPSLIMNS
jgi:DNA-binding FadR family transcriptional regulator